MTDRLWICWERHTRNTSMARELGAELLEIDYPRSTNRLVRYLLSTLKTISAVLSRRPSVLFVQNPSIVLSVLGVVLGKLVGSHVVVDAHNAGVYPGEGNSRGLQKVANWIMRHASTTIVTNDALGAFVTTNGGRPFVMPDPLPSFDFDLQKPEMLTSASTPNTALLVCSWAEDEPLAEIFDAIRTLPNLTVFASGRRKPLPGNPELPENLVPTGFLSESEFFGLMQGVDVVIDLTLRDDCLVCGAYEAIALEQPLLLSDTAALREYFSGGAVFTKNETEAIRAALVDMLERADELRAAVSSKKRSLLDDWAALNARLTEHLNDTETRRIA